jgi:hypothetical protein
LIFPKIIFSTAYDFFALQAFGSKHRYLLKNLYTKVEKCIIENKKSLNPFKPENIINLLDSIPNENLFQMKLFKKELN